MKQKGFTMLELTIVMAMSVVMSAVAIMGWQTAQSYLRIAGDLRNLNGMVGQAKMAAAADFTHARAFINIAANSYHLEVWNKAGNAGAGCWQTVGDTANACTAGASPVFLLSPGDTFGFAGIGGPPPNTQAAIGQGAACDNGKGGTIGNTACIVFNSRGIPYVPLNGVGPDGNGAFYVTNGTSVYALTVNAAGTSQDWSTAVKSVAWKHQ